MNFHRGFYFERLWEIGFIYTKTFSLKTAQGRSKKDSWAERTLDSLHGDDSANLPGAGLGLQCLATPMYFFEFHVKIQRCGWHFAIYLQSCKV